MANQEVPPVAQPTTESTTNSAAASSATDSSSSSKMTSASGEEFTADSKFSSLEDLRKRFPEMYNKFMNSLAQNIVDDMKKGGARIKEAWKKMREN